jgi:hypothetical protein
MDQEVLNNKMAEFVKVATSEITDLREQLSEYRKKEAAEIAARDEEFEAALKKAADALYNSDFITDEDEKRAFVKRAKEDSKYLARTVERVCNAADVAYMGKVATVKTDNNIENDPVMKRAFGFDSNYSLLDD